MIKRLSEGSYGLPGERKYPLDTKGHVKAAIWMFSRCPDSKKRILARNIKNAARKFGIKISSDSTVSKY